MSLFLFKFKLRRNYYELYQDSGPPTFFGHKGNSKFEILPTTTKVTANLKSYLQIHLLKKKANQIFQATIEKNVYSVIIRHIQELFWHIQNPVQPSDIQNPSIF